jgi:hypothetical protein
MSILKNLTYAEQKQFKDFEREHIEYMPDDEDSRADIYYCGVCECCLSDDYFIRLEHILRHMGISWIPEDKGHFINWVLGDIEYTEEFYKFMER